MRLVFAADTDVGLRRKNNEDAWLAYEPEGLYIVADGMGGHESGEVASRIAVESLRAFFIQTSPENDNTWPHVATDARTDLEDFNACRLVSAIQFAHRRIVYEVQREPEKAGMGTTVVTALFADDKVYIAHVGDSRCYCQSGDQFWQVTSDHTLANHMRRRYQTLTADQEERLKAFQHVVVRALGGNEEGDAQVDLSVLSPFPGDLFLLCSDGLTGELTDQEIQDILRNSGDLEAGCRNLIARAKEHGGRDNVTVLIARVEEVDAPSQEEVANRVTMEHVMDEDTLQDEAVEELNEAARRYKERYGVTDAPDDE